MSVASFAFLQTKQTTRTITVTGIIEQWQFVDLALKKGQISTVEDENCTEGNCVVVRTPFDTENT